ncbi:MAG TPA: molybdate ABC transporter substrate-binding protein [Nitrospirales bacterium]|nr:molybdate ABC transporter substrate-binding protein [Nitrospirales bacterium]
MLKIILLLTVLIGLPPAVAAGELTIAAASDLNFAFKELVSAYEKKTGQHVRLSLGSSGNFFSQIENGAPFDLYFSADIRYPQILEEKGHAVSGSLYKYAIGRIVLWASKDSKVAVEKGLEVLADPSIRKIAIANPKHAPYGRAAVAALESSKLHDRVKDRLVLGENISQTAQFIESGACDIGIIALSLALAPSMKAIGKYYEIPATLHPPLEQGAVVLKKAANPEQARAFLEFVKGPEGREIMQRYGFVLPG